jgi:hypothetical protein
MNIYLKDGVLHRFGLAKSAKRQDGQSSWNLKGVARLMFLFFLFLMLFVVYRLWISILHFSLFKQHLALID